MSKWHSLEARTQRGKIVMSAISEVYNDADDRDNIVDALTDLLHAKIVDLVTLEGITRIAIDHYDTEVKGEQN